MQRLLLQILLLLCTVIAGAQQHVITGLVVEDDTNEPLAQTTVRLLRADSTLAAGTLTALDGRFRLKAPAGGRYVVQVSCVGFKTFSKAVTLKADRDLPLGTIVLQPDAVMLKGATVTGQAAKVTLKADTFVYNASAYRTPEGSVVEELVRKLPGAKIDDDGKITINGKEVKKIMVDGKEFMTGDTKTAMKNLPTSIVERVKAYDQKSDLARVSGIDDGEEETVLDFGIKRGMNRGVMLNADLAAGTHHRYSGRLFGGWMKDDMKLFLMSSANNVNDMGFPGGGGGRFGGGRQGLTATKMTGVNLNYEQKDRLKLDGSVRWNHSDGDARVYRSTEDFMSSTASSFANSRSADLSRANSWDARMRIEWQPDSMTNIMLRPQFNYNSNDGLSDSQSATFSADPYGVSGITDPLLQRDILQAQGLVKNSNMSNAISYADSKKVGATLQLNRKLSTDGRNVTLRLRGNYTDGMSRSFSNDSVNYYLTGRDSTYQANRYAVTPTRNWDYSVRATYSEPIYNKVYLQLSYQYQYKYSKSDRGTFVLNGLGLPFFDVAPVYRGWGDYLAMLDLTVPSTDLDSRRSATLSRYSEYRNYIHNAELMLRVVRPAYKLNIGVQFEPQSSQLTYRYQTVDTITRRSVLNWTPTADFRWNISKVSQLRLTYRGSSSQPSMTDLLDITDDSNPLNVRRGNPGLKPAFTQTLRIFYNNYIQNHQRSIMAHLNLQTTRNSISNMVTYNEQTGARTTRPENINGNWNAFGMFMFNTALDSAAYFNVNTFTTLRYANSVGYVSVSRNADSQKSTTRSTTLGERLAASYRNDWLEVELNGSLEYLRARSELQTSNNLDTWNFSYGGSVQLTAPWGSQLSTNISMNSRRGYNDAALNTNELIWNAQLAHSFLRGNALTLSLQFYDLLHRQSTFSRTVSAMQRSDTQYNAVTSYAMLHVIYKLNLFGGFSNMRGRRGDGPRGDGGPRGDRPRDGRRGPGGGFGGRF